MPRKIDKSSEDSIERFIQEREKRKARPEQRAIVEEGENAKYLRHSLRMWDWQKVDLMDPAAVVDRIQKYLRLCEEDDMKPSIEGLALAFDMDRVTIRRNAFNTEWNKKVPDATRDALKKAYQIINVQMADYMANGKINPVAGIFLMKNNMGYEDKTEVVVSPPNPLGNVTETQKLEEKYINVISDQDGKGNET